MPHSPRKHVPDVAAWFHAWFRRNNRGEPRTHSQMHHPQITHGAHTPLQKGGETGGAGGSRYHQGRDRPSSVASRRTVVCPLQLPEVERLPRAKNEILKKGSQTRSGGLRATRVDVQAA